MKKKILYIIIMIIVLMITLKTYSNASTAKVKADNVNLREKASTDSKILDRIDKDAKIEVISDEGEWCKIKYNGIEGYIKKEFIGETIEEAVQQPTEEPKTPELSVPAETTIVNSGKIKVRILPTINSNIIAELENSENITVITETNNWKFIQNDEISGWIAKTGTVSKEDVEAIAAAIEEETNVEEKTEEVVPTEEVVEETSNFTKYDTPITMYVNANSIYLRTKPTTESKSITSLIKNTDVKVLGEEDGWYKVEHEGQTGYIRKDLLSNEKVATETSRNGDNIDRNTQSETSSIGSSSSSLGSQIVDYAYQFLGVPYVYGASGPSSFDCSGFTSYVYKHFGYSLQRSAAGQASNGVPVSKSDLQAGDIVLFLDYETMDKIGHVGIYVGDGNFIHASSGSGYCVKTSTLLSGSYKTRYAGARRII